MSRNSSLVAASGTVLIVDDDPAVRGSLKFRLEIEGYLVKAYSKGSDLLDEPNVPVNGCLVIDYRLSTMNGLELLAILRRRNVELPAILITSHPTPAVCAQAAAAGVLLIEKPLLNESLFDGIRAALMRR